MSAALISVLVIAGASWSGGCTSARRPSRMSSEATSRKRREIIWESLRFRRPSFAAAAADADPGGTDYQTAPRSAKLPWSCVLPRKMIQNAGLSPAKILECQRTVAALQKKALAAAAEGETVEPIRARWSLERGHPTAWVLKGRSAAEGTECIEQTLGRIPVPREAFFLSPDDEGVLQCFGISVDPGTRESVDATLPWDRLKLEMTLPLLSAEALNTPGISATEHEDQVIRLLLGVAFQPLWKPEGGVPRGIDRLAPSDCMTCLGRDDWERVRSSPQLTLWPSGTVFDNGDRNVRPDTSLAPADKVAR